MQKKSSGPDQRNHFPADIKAGNFYIFLDMQEASNISNFGEVSFVLAINQN
jgi:hypothetical protein